jgi:hypothetical protein
MQRKFNEKIGEKCMKLGEKYYPKTQDQFY